MIGFRIAREARFETVLNALRKKLTFWATTHLSLAGRVLIANQVFLASIWYVASCWCPQVCTMNKVKALVRNYIWSGENRKKQCRVKVAWDTMILPKELGGLKLLDLELEIKALLAKLFIRGLIPRSSPWKSLIQHRVNTLSSK
jgi:hypothetical protein